MPGTVPFLKSKLVFRLGLLDIRFCTLNRSLCLKLFGLGGFEFGGIQRIVNQGEDVAFPDDGAVIDALPRGIGPELRDHALNLGADIDQFLGLDRARRTDGAHQFRLPETVGPEDGFLAGVGVAPIAPYCQNSKGGNDDDENDEFKC